MHDTSEDYILVVKERKGSSGRNIELRLISMFKTVSLAHAEHSNFFMFDLEGFIFEFPSIEVAALFWVLGWFYSSTLDVHSFNDSVNLSVLVSELLTISSGMPLTECQEVCTCAWSNVMEQLEYNGLLTSLEVYVH